MGGSVSFCAPNWDPSVVRAAVPRGVAVAEEPFKSWLKEKGFQQHPGPGDNFTLGPIDIYVHSIEGEVAFLTIDFAPAQDALKRLESWRKFANELCEGWGFSLLDSKAEARVPVNQFLRVLSQDKIWQVVSESNGWPPIWTSAE
jgi:hypothetical protein